MNEALSTFTFGTDSLKMLRRVEMLNDDGRGFCGCGSSTGERSNKRLPMSWQQRNKGKSCAFSLLYSRYKLLQSRLDNFVLARPHVHSWVK
nr:hypothetical protein [Tanacetum cinerariifolium]